MVQRQVVLTSSDESLIDGYRPDDCFFLSSPQGMLLTEGELVAVAASEEPDKLAALSRDVAKAWDDAKRKGVTNPIVVGAVPFDPAKPAKLVVPVSVRRAEPSTSSEEPSKRESAGSVIDIAEVPAQEGYMSGVAEAVSRIQDGEFSKIVLSRTLQLTSAAAVDPAVLLRNLARSNPRGYTFAVPLPQSTLVGASPELLVSRKGLQVVANPLAGSAARSADPEEDQRRAVALLVSEKDLHEHAVVIQAVAEALRPFCRTLDVPDRPSLLQTPTMWHLSTEIKGDLLDPATTSLELAAALHPTPAVCGTPTDLARQAIQQIEPFDRGFFTGMVGWCDASGNGEWIVTIRCAEVSGRFLRLFAGAGIVGASKPEDELKETSAKFRTMLNAMGLDRI
ncbi:isochorismate synthase DhbC [Paenibacillus turpanensis]|uniref:isochorismate synthase DhbC n=1 Tax=Paenibacillus turpanensis TaxID=2689078 RepID=UPI00140E3045|nr:isochorismate synthase DhbC [Paenibacillus turpanensis]